MPVQRQFPPTFFKSSGQNIASPSITTPNGVGQTKQITYVAGTWTGSPSLQIRWYSEGSIINGENGSSYAPTLQYVNTNIQVAEYDPVSNIEALSQSIFIPLLGGTPNNIDTTTTTPTITWARMLAGGSGLGDTYDVEIYKDGSPVSLTGATGLDTTSYVVSPALTAYGTGYAWRLASHYGSNTVYSDLFSFTPSPYEMLDEMTAEVAAGAIDGTYATDGIHQRTAVDTGSHAVQTGGLAFLTPGGGDGDPRVIYPSVSRTAGKLVHISYRPTHAVPGQGTQIGLYQTAPTTSTGSPKIGFGTSQSGAGLTVRDPSITTAYVWDLDLGVDYQLVAAMKSIGYAAFIYDTNTEKWLLLHYVEQDSTATLIPAMTVQASTGIGYDNLVIPSGISWLPAPVLSDGFGGTTQTDGLAHSPEVTVDIGGGSVTWTDSLGTWANSSGVCAPTALNGGAGYAIRTIDSGIADYFAAVALTMTDTSKTMSIGGWVDVNNWFEVKFSYNGSDYQVSLIEVVGGSPNTVKAAANVGVGYAAGAKLAFRKVGTTIYMYYRHREFPAGTWTSYSLNSIFQSCTNLLLKADSTTNTFDKFIVFPYGSNNEYSELSNYLTALTPPASTLPAPPDSSPLSMPVNPGGFDLVAELAAAGAGGTLTLTTQGVYTVPDGTTISIPNNFTLNVAANIRVAIQTESGYAPSVAWGTNSVANGGRRIWFGGIAGNNTGTQIFTAPGNQNLEGICQLGAWNGMVVGYGKYNCTFSNFVQLNCGYESLYHANYVAESDTVPADKNITYNDFVIVKTGSGGGAGCAYRFGHRSYNITVNGGYVGQANMCVYEGDSEYGNTYTNVVFWSGQQASIFKGSGLDITNCLIGMSANVGGTYTGTPTPNIDQNGYVLVQRFTNDTNPIVLTLPQLESILGYSSAQLDECEQILTTKSNVTNTTQLQAFWEDRTLDYYIDILTTAAANWKTYIASV